MPGMEEFSLLSISGPRLSPSLSTLQDATSSPPTSLPGPAEPGQPGEKMFSKRHPDNAQTGATAELAGPAQALAAQAHGSLTRHGVDTPTLTPDQRPLDTGEPPRRRCSVYRPWFSPYSYFVCADRGSRLEASGFREAPWDEGRGDGWPAEDAGAESLGSSSSSPEHAGAPRGRARPESVTSRDILAACRGQLVQQSGYKCAACCRLYPTLHSLKSHIRSGAREGFSCSVYYRKLKALWGGQRARPGAGGQPCS
ncbi:spermatogenesis-associated protein 46 [Sorex fumeus]|uniref:spermatogenesis-associated protein 46 n=1 Tax=Sorex fumeus TaxID=62283 RepID=UPI0024ADB278|nr:spermatogenesis-associated protein 46 [Sorex fumeus]